MAYLTKLIEYKDRKFTVTDKGNTHYFDTLTEAKAFCKDVFETECAERMKR